MTWQGEMRLLLCEIRCWRSLRMLTASLLHQLSSTLQHTRIHHNLNCLLYQSPFICQSLRNVGAAQGREVFIALHSPHSSALSPLVLGQVTHSCHFSSRRPVRGRRELRWLDWSFGSRTCPAGFPWKGSSTRGHQMFLWPIVQFRHLSLIHVHTHTQMKTRNCRKVQSLGLEVNFWPFLAPPW